MTYRFLRVISYGVFVACIAVRVPAQTVPAITPEDLRSRLVVFAADSMFGRATATKGHTKATEYLARELTRMHIKPAGDKNSYYQAVPMDRVEVDLASASLSISHGAVLKPGVDFLPIVGHFGVPFATDAQLTTHDVIEVRGLLSDLVEPEFMAKLRPDTSGAKIDTTRLRYQVVLRAPARVDSRPDYQLWNVAPRVEQYRGAAALLVESLDLMPRSVRAQLAGPAFMLTPDKLPEPTARYKPPPKIPPVVAITRSAADLLRTASGSIAGVAFRSVITPVGAPTRNVVAMIEGSDTRLRAELVVLSAHADHLGIAAADMREGADSIMNGADVGGSGSVALLELAEYLAASPEKPRRTIVFLWTVGEEQGMLGSQYFVNHVDTTRLGKVVANINVDAIGRGGAGDILHGGPDYVQVIGATQLSTEYAHWLDKLIRDPQYGLRPDDEYDVTQHHKRASCTGDHWTFARAGIPSVFVTTGDNPDARSVTDAPGTIDYAKLTKVTRFVGALTLAVANRDERPALADSVVGPLALCGQ